jgi:hypothetical protein
MKHLIRMIFSVSLVLFLTVSLCACGSKTAADLSGTYTLTALKDAGEEGTQQDPSSLGLTGELVLNEDGTGTMTANGNQNSFTYDSEAMIISMDGTDCTFTYDNGVIEFSADGAVIYVFTKNQ